MPTLFTMVYTYWYIFLMMRRLKHGVPIHDKEYATALAENLANPSHVMSFLLIAIFWISWTPYAGVRLYEYVTGSKLQVSTYVDVGEIDRSNRYIDISNPLHSFSFTFRYRFYNLESFG